MDFAAQADQAGSWSWGLLIRWKREDVRILTVGAPARWLDVFQRRWLRAHIGWMPDDARHLGLGWETVDIAHDVLMPKSPTTHAQAALRNPGEVFLTVHNAGVAERPESGLQQTLSRSGQNSSHPHKQYSRGTVARLLRTSFPGYFVAPGDYNRVRSSGSAEAFGFSVAAQRQKEGPRGCVAADHRTEQALMNPKHARG